MWIIVTQEFCIFGHTALKLNRQTANPTLNQHQAAAQPVKTAVFCPIWEHNPDDQGDDRRPVQDL